MLKESKVPTQEVKETTDKAADKAAEKTEDKNIVLTVDNISVEERQLLGRYGVWLLVGRCTPDENTPIEIMGRILAMLFHWFHMTAYSYDGKYYLIYFYTLSQLQFRFRAGRKYARKIKNRKYMWLVKRS